MSTKANEIAALERKMKDTSNKTIQAALKKKIERLKTEMKGEKPMTANQLATTLLKAKGKVREMNSKEFSAMIKRLSAKPEYKFLKGMEKSDIERDLERQAKPVGWRFRGNSTRKPTAKEIAAGKKSGKVYFEDRANRSDVSRVAQLKKGGKAGGKDRSNWGKHDLNKMYVNTTDLCADLLDYFADLKKEIDANYADQMKTVVINALQTGKI